VTSASHTFPAANVLRNVYMLHMYVLEAK